MAIKIVDKKKLNLTDDEYQMYQKICRSYDTTARKGEDLFVDLFESDDNGIIVYLKPPSQRYCSFEIFLFMMSIMQHQHLRIMREEFDAIKKEQLDLLDSLKKSAKNTE